MDTAQTIKAGLDVIEDMNKVAGKQTQTSYYGERAPNEPAVSIIRKLQQQRWKMATKTALPSANVVSPVLVVGSDQCPAMN